MIIKFNKGVFVFTEKIQVIKLGHYTPYLATLNSLRHQDRVRKTLTLTALWWRNGHEIFELRMKNHCVESECFSFGAAFCDSGSDFVYAKFSEIQA